MLHVTLNGTTVECPGGTTILDALRREGIEIPLLCHDDRLVPTGGCRMCLVDIAGWPHPAAACTTPLADGMSISTDTPSLRETRRTLLKLLADQYPADAVTAFPEKDFHRLLREYQVPAGINPPSDDDPFVDATHPYIAVDMRRCISCFRCVRICSEVQGQDVWRIARHDGRPAILPDKGQSLLESSCVSCGACVNTCPTGALEDKSVLAFGNAEAWTRTTCPYCGVGCETSVGTRNGRIVEVRPVIESPVNAGHLCVKGRYATDFVYASDRVTEPMLRRGGEWEPVSWEEAITHTARELNRLRTEFGPDSVGFLGSARATNEENYLMQKFARAVFGTNNVDCCARVCHAPSAAALKAMLGTGASTNSFDDIERARTILLCGANATENHPIVGTRIRQAVRRGATLLVVDPRRIELAHIADTHLRVRPGTTLPLFHAMAATIIEENLVDAEFIRERVDGYDEFQDFVRAFRPEAVAELCGVRADLIRRAARLYAAEKPAMSLHGLGLTEHVQGTETVMALINLALLTGNIGKPGAGVNPLRGQNNVQGSAQMGCEPGNLTGYASLADARERFETLWSTQLSTVKGLNLLDMTDAARNGKLKGLWAMGYDVVLTNPNVNDTLSALKNLDLVIVQDLFLNETAKTIGTVFLPAVSAYEKDGTFMNAERRIQRIRQAIAPIGNAKADWEILCSVARAMGDEELFSFESPIAVWEEIRRLWPAAAGISYARLESSGIQWPCPTEDHAGTTFLHRTEFPIGRKARLRPIAFTPTPEKADERFPFLLVTGRTLYQFNAGTMTMRTANRVLRPTDTLDIAPEDAQKLGIVDGMRVTVRSRYGATTLPARITETVRVGELFATFHTIDSWINRVTGSHQDSVVGAPEYKVTAVRLETAVS